MMNEYEMLLKYKETKDQSILYTFFIQYQGLIHKLYRKGFYSNFHISIEDFKQECFLMLQSIMDYIDIKKIPDPEHWKLYSLYMSKIMFYRGWIVTASKRDAYFYSVDTDMEDMDFISYPAENDLKLTLDIFVEKLNYEDQLIFKSRFLDEDTKTYKEIASMHKKSYFYIYNRVENLLNQFYEYIKEEPSRRN